MSLQLVSRLGWMVLAGGLMGADELPARSQSPQTQPRAVLEEDSRQNSLPTGATDLAFQLETGLQGLANLPASVPFQTVIRATTGHQIIALDTNQSSHRDLCRKIQQAAALAGERARQEGIASARANEAGNRIEQYVLAALQELKLATRIPVNSAGRAQAAGYPDLEIMEPVPCYLELKTYSAGTANTTQRSFYYSPSAKPKVTQDALHLMLAFELTKETRSGKPVFVPVHWKLLTLEDLQVHLKLEFNQSNRELYGHPEAEIGGAALTND